MDPRSLRQYLRNQISFSHQGYLLFDDTVLNKRHSHFIEMVRRQWSGNAHAVIPGIGVVTCVYVNLWYAQIFLLLCELETFTELLKALQAM